MFSSVSASNGMNAPRNIELEEFESEKKSASRPPADTQRTMASSASRASMVGPALHCEQCPYDDPVEQLTGFQHVRALLHRTLEDPSSSPLAQGISSLIVVLILVSTVAICIETLPDLEDSDVWFPLETVIVIIFTVEYVLRILVTRNILKFIIAPLNVIDLLAIVPYYIELWVDAGAAQSLRVFRVVRLARIFRLFKISRYSSYMQIMAEALSRSADAFGLLLFFVSIAVIIFSSVMYFAEKDEPPSTTSGINPFTSIPATFYWCIVTMTTVGYVLIPLSVFGTFLSVSSLFSVSSFSLVFLWVRFC